MYNKHTMIQINSPKSSARHRVNIENMSSDYNQIVDEINKEIQIIIKEIKSVNSLKLLKHLYSSDFLSKINMWSEINYTQDQNLTVNTLEYVQSILISNTNQEEFEGLKEEINDDTELYSIENKVHLLFKKLIQFYYHWGAYAKIELGINKEESEYIVESQLLSMVRGKRYQVHQKEYLETQLLPFDELLQETFKMSANDLVNGLLNIESSLTQRKMESFEELVAGFEKFQKLENPEEDTELKSNMQETIENTFGVRLNEVGSITKWPTAFISALTCSINESSDFKHSEFPYWPITTLSIQKKPFIRIEEKVYCFCYYNLFDNIYRIVQKSLSAANKINIDKWQEMQKESSESTVAELFQKILPDAKVYRDNYYPVKTSLKQMNENDLIIEFENTLIIIEVKAGAFVPVTAITDYKAHLKSYKTLVETADVQCQRTIEYLTKNKLSQIYSSDRQLKKEFEMSRINNIYSMCITIDDFNEFASKAEKINGINIEQGTIVLSIDDLRVYKDFFESPLIFLHYLKHRSLATSIESLKVNDELDHLGLYLAHNTYSLTFSNQKKNSTIHTYGYREHIDNYFMGLTLPVELRQEKPEQDISNYIKEILKKILNSELENKSDFSNFLLDFSSEGAKSFEETVTNVFERQKELKKMVPVVASGKDVFYVLFIKQNNIKEMPLKIQHEYVDGMLAYKKIESAMLIHLELNEEKLIQNLFFKQKFLTDIRIEEIPFYERKGRESFESRKLKVQEIAKKRKIGRNTICICGSGKKYKRCCGR